jgi:hypothetical protein
MTSWVSHLGRFPDPNASVDHLHVLASEGIDVPTVMFLRDSASWSRRSLGDAFPGMSRIGFPGPLEDLSVRATNMLRNQGVHDWPAFAALTPALVWATPNLGVKTFVEILKSSTARWAREALIGSLTPPLPDFEVTPGAAPVREYRPGAETPVTLLATLLVPVVEWGWEIMGARTVAEAMTAAAEHRELLPDAIAEAFERFMTGDAAGIAGRPKPDEALWTALEEFDDRERAVLEERVVPENGRRTLDDLGREWGVTRERIRQVETQVRRTLDRRQVADEFAGFRHLCGGIAQRCGPVIERTAFEAAVAEAVRDSSDESVPPSVRSLRTRLLRRALPNRIGIGEWLVTEHIDEQIRELAAALRAADSLEVDEHVRSGVADILAGTPAFEEQLLSTLDLRRMGPEVVRWPRSQTDRAYVVLREFGETLSMFELQQRTDPTASPRSFAQRVQADPRLMRRGRDRYGLRAWGGEEYSGIMDELEQAIERAGGRIDLDETVTSFVREFDVSENSVRSYASHRRFQRFPDGTLGFREADDPGFDPSRHPIELAARCYRLGGTWHLRQLVTADTLRGSGAQLRAAPALEFGLEPDLVFAVDFDGHPVTLTWTGNQPSIGALRALALHHGCQEGDLLFLPMDGEEPRTAFAVRGSEVALMVPEQRLAKEMGLVSTDPEEDDAFDVADAVGLSPGADWHDIAVRLEERREPDLAVLIPTSWRR